MTTDKYLGQVIRFSRMTINKMSEIQRYREMATSITVANKEDKIQTSSDKDKLGSMVAKIVDLDNQINEMEKTRETIISQIESIDDSDMYAVLYAKYITDQKLSDVRRDIHCSKSTIYRIYEEAMNLFEEKYGEMYLHL